MSTLHRKTCHLEGFYITRAFLRSRGYSSWFVLLFFFNDETAVRAHSFYEGAYYNNLLGQEINHELRGAPAAYQASVRDSGSAVCVPSS